MTCEFHSGSISEKSEKETQKKLDIDCLERMIRLMYFRCNCRAPISFWFERRILLWYAYSRMTFQNLKRMDTNKRLIDQTKVCLSF